MIFGFCLVSPTLEAKIKEAVRFYSNSGHLEPVGIEVIFGFPDQLLEIMV